MTSDICSVSGETAAEERLNHLSHLAGLILSIIGAIVLLRVVSLHGDLWALASGAIYAVSLVSLYAASTCYHSCQDRQRKRKLRIVDHACIYLLIAGTYTPFTLGPLRDADGLNLLAIEWGIAALGIVFKIFAVHRFQIISTLAYLAMGWLVIFSWPVLMENLPQATLVWLAAGGLFYTVGTIFYAWKALPWQHAIWHVFVLGGSLCHYFAVLDVV